MEISKPGFSGAAASNYFIETANALSDIQQSIESAGDMASGKDRMAAKQNMDDSNRSIYDFTMEKNYANEYDTVVSKLASAYATDTVRSDDDRYDYIGTLYKNYDQEMNDKLNYVISEMEALCGEHFQVPTATPKVEMALEKIKNTLPQSSDLANETVKEISNFANEIREIDMSSAEMARKQWVVDGEKNDL